MINWLNKIRLVYHPYESYNKSILTDPMTLETAKKNSASALNNFLVVGMSPDELMIHTQVLQNAVNELSFIIHKLRKHEQDYEFDKVRNEIRGQVHKRDTKLVRDTVENRDKETKIKAVKSLGEKVSPDGLCYICQNPSTALLCSQNCKDNHKMIQGSLKLGRSIEQCRQMLKDMGKL
jgi:hypothetical protein